MLGVSSSSGGLIETDNVEEDVAEINEANDVSSSSMYFGRCI